MAQTICYEVFPKERNIRKMRRMLVNRHGFTEKQNQYGSYFYIEAESLDSWQIQTVLNVHGYKYKSYDKRYSRNSSYRKEFFENNKGPYHCVYCGRRLKSKDVEVDHLIPVAKAKSNMWVRVCLQVCGITNVNDVKNLVASCPRCNRKKSDKIGLWAIRGAIGKHRLFWGIRNIIIVALVLLGMFIACSAFPLLAIIKDLIMQIS